MFNFAFHNPVKVLFGKGQIAALGREIPLSAKVLLTYGRGSIKKNGVYDQVRAALGDRSVLEFGGIEPNPSYETLMDAVELARKHDIDFLLAVGGGSVLDGTKFIAVASPFLEGDPWDLLARRIPPKKALAIGCVLTLPATGSEMNPYAVVSRKSTQDKLAFSSPLLFPKFSVLDPETTFSLPPRQIGNGVVDAFVHVMEQYLTYPVSAPVQDRFAEGVLKTLIETGPVTLASPEDYDARASVVWCATMALNGLLGAGVPQDWSTHTIGHEFTALHGLDHAQTLAIVLPNLLWVQRESKREKLLQYAERVWDLREGKEELRIEEAIIRTRSFFEAMGFSTHLSDHGIGEDRFDEILRRFTSRGLLPMGEKKNIGPEQVSKILAMCR